MRLADLSELSTTDETPRKVRRVPRALGESSGLRYGWPSIRRRLRLRLQLHLAPGYCPFLDVLSAQGCHRNLGEEEVMTIPTDMMSEEWMDEFEQEFSSISASFANTDIKDQRKNKAETTPQHQIETDT